MRMEMKIFSWLFKSTCREPGKGSRGKNLKEIQPKLGDQGHLKTRHKKALFRIYFVIERNKQ